MKRTTYKRRVLLNAVVGWIGIAFWALLLLWAIAGDIAERIYPCRVNPFRGTDSSQEVMQTESY